LLDELFDDLVAFKFVTISSKGEAGRWLDLDRVFVLIVPAEAKPDAQVVPRTDLNHIGAALSSLRIEVFQELLIGDV